MACSGLLASYLSCLPRDRETPHSRLYANLAAKYALILIKDRLESTLSISENRDPNSKIEPISRPIEIKVEIYDPIFTSQDTLLLEKGLGFTCLEENKAGNYSFRSKSQSSNESIHRKSSFEFKTFIYMPHCPRTLYENFLRSNWNKETLKEMLFCWNDLRGYADR